MSTREIDLGESAPLAIDLGADRGAQLARLLTPPAPVLVLPCRKHVEQSEPRRFSRLKLMDESPAHYEDGTVEETSPMRKGTALHAFLLGQKHRVVVYKGRRDPRAAAWQEFQKEHEGKCILIPSEAEPVLAMRASVEKHRRAMELLEGEQERRIEWDFGGKRCAGTPDSVRDYSAHRRVTELKSTLCAKPVRLIKRARWSHWHAQVAWYSEGLDRTMSYPQLPCEEHYVVAVESKKPFNVTTLRVTPEMITKGQKAWRAWWERLEVCEQSNHFPGYSEADIDWVDEEKSGLSDWEDEDEDAA